MVHHERTLRRDSVHPNNVLILMVDEMTRAALGCMNQWPVRTPHLDRLAASGVRFTQAYSNSPICVPVRAVVQTGQYVHQIRHWDSATPYDGTIPGWSHELRRRGFRVNSIGKLHFRAETDDYGFDTTQLPMHVKDGVGWAPGLLRRPLGDFPAAAELAVDVGIGDTDYQAYDRRVRDAACAWLESHAGDGGAPWALFVSFVSPHYPLTGPAEYARLYDPAALPAPVCYAEHARPRHPAVREMLRFFDYDAPFDAELAQRARQAYFALVSFVDALIGDVLGALERSGAGLHTTVIFTSDHGEMLGDHGIWTKQVMYEGSVGVPMILAGGGIDIPGVVCPTPCSLVDLYPTILHAATGGESHGPDGPGESLLDLADTPPDPERPVLSEYHDGGSVTGAFMLRRGRWKLVHHVGYASQLFDLEDDPDETTDLAGRKDLDKTLLGLEVDLQRIVDPAAADRQAFADQAARIEQLGGLAAVQAMAAGLSFNHTPAP